LFLNVGGLQVTDQITDEKAGRGFGRRELLTAGVGAGAAILAGCAKGPGSMQAVAMANEHEHEFDPTLPEKFNSGLWTRDAFARLSADMDFGKVKRGWYAGSVMGVRENEKIKPLMNFEGFSCARLLDNGDGSYQKLLRELVFYKDLRTGKILETFENPYTGETVRVVPVANDPFNHLIEQYYPKGPSYGGLNKLEEKPRVPLRFPWYITREDTVVLATDIHLLYPSALQPDKWPRESSGPMNRVSEMFRYVIRREELENPDITSVTYTGTWSRITPWLPWMLMGQAPGHITYYGAMGGFDDLSMVSPEVLAYAEKHYPKYFDAPTELVEPSLSSLENYARTEKPAPVL
jgi:hypothetical protein